MWKKSLAIVTAAVMAGSAMQPAFAQPYDRDRYDRGDRYDRDYGPPPPPPDYGPAPPGDYGPAPPPPGPAAYDRYRDYDPYYRDCQRQRSNNTAGGAIIGALAGGLFGNAVSGRGSRGAGTILGAVAGGAVGAAIGNNVSCQDRDEAYRRYYSGLNSGRVGRYDWRGREARGYLDVNSYWRGPDGARCASYDQTVVIHGRPEYNTGYACQQRDGAWAFFG